MAYSGRKSLDAALERLARERAAPHFVGHSLGGVLIFDLLSRHPEIGVARIVLIGAPVNGCLAGRRLGTWQVGRWMLGASAPRWESCAARWQRPEPLGVIAARARSASGARSARCRARMTVSCASRRPPSRE